MFSHAKALHYYSENNFLKRTNPLAKLTALASLSAILFISRSIWIHTGIFFFAVALFIILPFSFCHFQGAKFLIIATMFIGLLQVIFVNEGEILVNLYLIEITKSGLINSVSASSRFMSVILLSYLFVLSTDPGEFVVSLVNLGLPYRFGYALITALRMIPLVKAEVEKILFAQITRGANYALFPLMNMVRSFKQFLKVVMIAILKRVNQLVISMEGRSFGLYKERSTLSVISYKWTDKAVIITSITLIPIILLIRL
jgi:energy-coupling factor transport system permease protein